MKLVNKKRTAEYEAAKNRVKPYVEQANAILDQISATDKAIIKAYEDDVKNGVKARVTHDNGKVIQIAKPDLTVQYWKFDKNEYIGKERNTLISSVHNTPIKVTYRPRYTVKEGFAVQLIAES